MKIKGFSRIFNTPRKKESFDKSIGIIQNGEDNAYPTEMERLINNSITAKQTSKLYASFLTGQGFVDQTLNDIVVGVDSENGKNITTFDLLRHVSREFSKHSGTWIKVQYNGELKTSGLKIAPSRYCRFGKKDDQNYSGRIAVYDNWDKANGKFDKSDILKYNTYNTNEKAIKYQITGEENPADAELIKGLKDWKGQIYHLFLDDEYTYPLSLIDVVQHDSDTEFQISLFKNGELRRGFFAKHIIAYDEFEDDNEREQFEADLKSFEGAAESGSTLLIEGAERNTENGEYILPLAIEKIEQNINDKLFKEYETSTSNNIRKAYNNAPPVLIDYVEGKLGGTSGESISQARDFYNEQTEMERLIIKGIFTELFKNWKDEQYNNKDWTIKKLGDGTTNIV